MGLSVQFFKLNSKIGLKVAYKDCTYNETISIGAKGSTIINIFHDIPSDSILNVNIIGGDPLADGYLAPVSTRNGWIMLYNSYNSARTISKIIFRIFYMV